MHFPPVTYRTYETSGSLNSRELATDCITLATTLLALIGCLTLVRKEGVYPLWDKCSGNRTFRFHKGYNSYIYCIDSISEGKTKRIIMLNITFSQPSHDGIIAHTHTHKITNLSDVEKNE
jgi:hypothetical protein